MANSLNIALPAGDCITAIAFQNVIDQLVSAIQDIQANPVVDTNGALLANGTVALTGCLVSTASGCVSGNNVAVWSDINAKLSSDTPGYGLAKNLLSADLQIHRGIQSVTFDGAGNGALNFSTMNNVPTVVVSANTAVAIGVNSVSVNGAVLKGPPSTTESVSFIAIGTA